MPDLSARGVRPFLAAAVIFLGIAGTAGSTEVYTVSGIEVDETAETAAAARDQAIAAGHRLAFERLTARLVPRAGRERLPPPAAPLIPPMVSSFGIDEEKTSDVRYLGKLTFRFREADVRRHFRSKGVSFAETRSKPVLVLPLYEDAGALLLWDRPNPWFEAWRTLLPVDGLLPLLLPVGDFADMRDLSPEQGATGDADRLKAFADRYGAAAVAAMRAGVRIRSGSRSLTVTIRFFGGERHGKTETLEFAYDDRDGLGAVIERAARDTADRLEDDWKKANLLQFDDRQELVAAVPLAGLRDWVEIRSRLRSAEPLSQATLVSISRREATVRLSYYGASDQLRLALAQRDLLLEDGSGNWTLRRIPPEFRIPQEDGTR